MNSFEKTFEYWLEESLSVDIPENVCAFAFNLFECGDFGITIIGAERFDSNDEDWTCDEIWHPSQRTTDIPLSYSGENWEECLVKIKQLIIKILDSNKTVSNKLKSSKAVAIGFVDGNLQIIWQKN